MQNAQPSEKPPRSPLRKWIRLAFLAWALVSTLWLLNSFRTQGVDSRLLESSRSVVVLDTSSVLEFQPNSPNEVGLIFICGAGVSAEAYAPLLRPIAERGYPTFIVKLPFRIAPFESHKQTAIDRACSIVASHPEFSKWVVAGHSLGGALACRVVQNNLAAFSGLALVGTTHPKRDDLSDLPMPVVKIVATNDGVAPIDKVNANKPLLPAHTIYVLLDGGNHSQFGHYGHQLLDRRASISREAQQEATRDAMLRMLKRVGR
jgi:predicted alpha/beta-hydrolase family hydrolase